MKTDDICVRFILKKADENKSGKMVTIKQASSNYISNS